MGHVATGQTDLEHRIASAEEAGKRHLEITIPDDVLVYRGAVRYMCASSRLYLKVLLLPRKAQRGIDELAREALSDKIGRARRAGGAKACTINKVQSEPPRGGDAGGTQIKARIKRARCRDRSRCMGSRIIGNAAGRDRAGVGGRDPFDRIHRGDKGAAYVRDSGFAKG